MGLFDFLTGGQPQQVVVPQYTGVQIQTSSSGLPIPIVYGVNVVAPNIILAGAFTVVPIYSTGNHPVITDYNYLQNLIFGLCEGPISGIGLIFIDGDIDHLGDDFTGYAAGTIPAVPAAGPTFAASSARAMGYAGTAYVYCHNFYLGSSATAGSINIETRGIFPASASINNYDADPALVIQDFLTNPLYGVGLPAAAIDTGALLSPAAGSPDSSYQGYCKATSLGLSISLTAQEKANSIISRWLQLTNATALYSGGKLKVVPYGDSAVAQTLTTGTISQPIPAIDGDTTDGPSLPYIKTNNGFVSDGGVVNANTGLPLRKVAGVNSIVSGTYAMSAVIVGRYLFSTDDINLPVTITFSYVPVASFVPAITPVSDLTDDDFLGDASADPVLISRTDPTQIANIVNLEILDRNNLYSATVIQARDQDSIERYGPIPNSTITAHEITNAQSAQIVAQLILQRALGVRNTYQFKLSWEFVLLEAMDVVTLTDTNLGLIKAPVRITEIEEDQDGLLAVTAEDLVATIGTAAAYGTGGAVGGSSDTTASPGLVNPPIVFEAPSQIAGNTIELSFGVSASQTTPADPLYGGCNVFASFDGGLTFTQIASFMGQSDQGVLAAPLPAFAGSGADTTDTLNVDVTQSGATLDASTQAQAQALQTLVLVDNEIIAYGNASGTPGATYALTYFERGLYGSPAVAHQAGAPFLELGGVVGSATLPNSAMGIVAQFKFQGFNIFGKGVQPLSACATYSKMIYGSACSARWRRRSRPAPGWPLHRSRKATISVSLPIPTPASLISVSHPPEVFMSVQVKARREAESFLSTYAGAQGELLVDTTNDRVQVHDGATKGGFPAARLNEIAPNGLATFKVASLPAGATGQICFATDGRKIAEASGAGTGVMVCFSAGTWRRLSDDSAVAS